ncbi:MAG TPA: GNAT family protein [Nitrolancea sp.]|jgi:RimJ/RimL family protein N-acetyltransferase|nr:GNAT family protein [Nitrolancea sp.]
MQAIYLMGTNVYLRAMIASDKDCGIAWFNTRLPLAGFGNLFPIDATRASEQLKSENRGIWPSGYHRYAIVRNAGDAVVGGLVEESGHPVVVRIGIHMAPALPDADSLRAEALSLVVPWLRDEREFRLIQIYLPADECETIAAAEAVGMSPVARLRRHVARPGTRTDLVMYEAVNPRWASVDA